MNTGRHTYFVLVVLLVLALALGPFLPNWQFLVTIALANGLAVLGMLILLRTGLLSFGQALYYCLGAYSVGALGHLLGTTDVLVLLAVGTAVSVIVAVVLGFLLANYRDLFFAMLTLAFSMILYGLLVNSAALGSTDGFNVLPPTILGRALGGGYGLYVVTCVVVFVAATAVHHYFSTPLGWLASAIHDNEIRVEYMGASVRNAVYVKYVIAAALTGAGGVLAAMATGHVSPGMAYWTTSGDFVFVAILAGTGNVIAPFLGSLVFELVRSEAQQYSPNTWQMTLGIVLLLIILFLPRGLWSLFTLRRRGA
ncbi:MAG: branched-chain amino acid ABC transporter permease [Burkholderiaceae bacterium]|jgi:branched-chain amino acid transport system permease protein|nr:MAG: branched-chain amino acid ABC transporter permease [Burkholderiaceae bacterium]